MMSPLTSLIASLSPSTLLAISFANRFLPSSLTLSASSRLLASSSSSGDKEVGEAKRKDFKTGEEAMVDEDIKEWRYERRVSLFFSRASLLGIVV